MSQLKSFVITPSGKSELDNPTGELTLDQRQILSLVDGHRTIKEVSQLVSSTTSLYLNEFFEYLLLAGLITDASEANMPIDPTRVPFKKAALTTQVLNQDRLLLTESERRACLEQDLKNSETQLAQLSEEHEQLANKYKRIKQQVLSYKEGMESRIVAQQAELDIILKQNQQSLSQRVQLETELKTLREEFEQQQELMERKTMQLEDAVKVRMSKERLISEEQQRQKMLVADEMVHTHPRYKKIRDLDFFRNFGNLELAELLLWAEWRVAEPGEVVLQEGDIGTPFFVVVSGRLVVEKSHKILTILKPGTPFGEGFYLEHENSCRSASVVAKTDCELLRIDPAHLDSAELGSRMRIAEAFMRIQTKRLRAASQMLKNLLAHS
ncbi:MAG: cyclic nucleotide-binding domain-containing protein [Gallionella sp.]|nr:cyclic nucleotide-binding domain-containing protein [Gallionella sp.]